MGFPFFGLSGTIGCRLDTWWDPPGRLPIIKSARNDALIRDEWPTRCVACHWHGTGLSRFLPLSWDHQGCQLGDHRRVVRRCGSWAAATVRVIWRNGVAYREVHVIEVQEVLRAWLGGEGLRSVAGHGVVSPGVCPGA
jgi:hypothetical protein